MDEAEERERAEVELPKGALLAVSTLVDGRLGGFQGQVLAHDRPPGGPGGSPAGRLSGLVIGR